MYCVYVCVLCVHGVCLCCGDVCVVCLCNVCVSEDVSVCLCPSVRLSVCVLVVSVACLCLSHCVFCVVWHGWCGCVVYQHLLRNQCLLVVERVWPQG